MFFKIHFKRKYTKDAATTAGGVTINILTRMETYYCYFYRMDFFPIMGHPPFLSQKKERSSRDVFLVSENVNMSKCSNGNKTPTKANHPPKNSEEGKICWVNETKMDGVILF
jgi:hypothetical protein